MQEPEIYAVVMAGGSGTRFWPASRRDVPKQFLPIAGERPMLAETVARIEELVPLERTLVVAAAGQEAEVRRCLPELPADNLLLEPEARNTGPCAALAAFEVEHRSPDSIQVLLPADHVIAPPEAFRRSLRAACREAADGRSLLTLGIRPTSAATGFGYIEVGEILGESEGQAVHRVLRFVEKPDATRARIFLERGFLWNSGIFVWHTRAVRRAIAEHMPLVEEGLRRWRTGAELAEVYPDFPSEPVDVAILEKAPAVRVIPIDYAWSDVGSWTALAEVLPADAEGNVSSGGGELVARDARGCVVYGEAGSLTALIGVEDLVVVHARGATLVCPADRAQEVRELVERLEREGGDFL